MEHYINLYSEYLRQIKRARDNTVSSYMRDLRHLNQYMSMQGKNEINEITHTSLVSYILFLEAQGKSAATISRKIAAIRGFFLFLLRQGVIGQDPSQQLDSPKVEKRDLDIMTVEEITRLLNQPQGSKPKALRDRAMLRLLYASGLRVSELIELNVGDIDFNFMYVRCHRKGNSIVPFDEATGEALRIYLEQGRDALCKDSQYLFTNLRGEKMTRQGFWKLLREYAVEAGIKRTITPQMIRHSFAMHLIENGADLFTVKELLGYVDMNATQVYQKKHMAMGEVYRQAHPNITTSINNHSQGSSLSEE